MKMNHRSLIGFAEIAPLGRIVAAGLALSLVLAGCSGSSNSGSSGSTTPAINPAAAANAGNFSRTVFLGDSLTAGYQSSSLLDTQQVHGYAPLVATQAGFGIALPLIAYPGAPNVLQLMSVGPPPVIVTAPGTTTGRDDFGLQPTDLAVPGALVNDVANTVPLLTPKTGQEQINQLVLGYPGFGYGAALSQAQQAIAADPTTIFLWIGNNDALVADLTGMPSSMTSLTNFTSQYQALIQLLTTKTNAHLVIANIPDVTLVPYLQPAALILGEYSAATSLPVATLSALLGIVPGDFVTPAGLAQIPLILGGTQKGVITDAGVLSAAEVVTVKAQVVAFNQVIAQQASAVGATLVDINALFSAIASQGITVGGVTGTAAFLGGIFSLDGIHPTNTGYAVVANKFIDSMNAGISTKIPDVSLAPIAATDPLWPPNLVKN
ncbi:SGNH/GDSL hydrolase family protein [Granulicella sibirica]|uniref:Uncharacterized protein n=1 Tax=Granulicella sibirica TaxID=2479048 RepID=A0A4Q0T944_9BACT|nr:SGNH/GDSL hydrolase family protein [Granulicella sibirica]RXH58559.1 hypothetical protein GRAN_1869 [Granulicella sibirica]